VKARSIFILVLFAISSFKCIAVESSAWKPVSGHIMTRWAKYVSPSNAHPEYPRPTMVRGEWMNLNGLWDFAITKKQDSMPTVFEKSKILVPYPVESALSGVGHIVEPDERVWYRRTFLLPRTWIGRRILLHFGAVDWDTTVYVNGKEIGRHTGGYDPFFFDISNALKTTGAQEIVVSVWDPTDRGGQPHGKQVLNPGGIMYTGTTGIWQTVWIEPVAKEHILSYKAVPDVDNCLLRITVNAEGVGKSARVKVQALSGEHIVSNAYGTPGAEIMLPMKNAILWSPSHPYLYGIKIVLVDNGKQTDSVKGYFGMRKISIKKDESGINRLALNNKILFEYGPLDQGFWPDGIYTAPTDNALRYDIEVMKKLGCNMMRKHVKVEPERLYYWADKLGLLIWQDMPAGSNPPEMRSNFESELVRMVKYLENHPSVVMWIIFNEGWGQYDTPRLVNMVKKIDPSRLVSNASGWSDTRCGDVIDVHSYPGPAMAPAEPNRVSVLGEFGGIGRPIKGHLWKEDGSWGYVSFKNAEEATDMYVGLLAKLKPLISKGLSAAVYTQTTDVEVEVNGLMTYDREEIKFDAKRAAEAAARLYEPSQPFRVVVPCAEQQAGIIWRYTTTTPPSRWQEVDFDDSLWQEGEASFGTVGPRIGTRWETSDIWIRRRFDLDSVPSHPYLNVFHDEDAEIYINGVLAAELKGYTTSYVLYNLDSSKTSLLHKGHNTIAIHCHQTGGGQNIDCGILESMPLEKHQRNN